MNNRQDALLAARREQPQLFIIDTAVPGSVDELALELKLLPKLAKVPIVALTGPVETVLEDETFAAALKKPVDRGRFCRTVRELLGRRMRRRIRQQRSRPLNLAGQR